MVPAIFLGLALAFLKIKDLNAFLLGENYARSLGCSNYKQPDFYLSEHQFTCRNNNRILWTYRFHWHCSATHMPGGF